MDNSTPHKSSSYDEQITKVIPYYQYFHSETIRIVKSVNPNPEIWLDTGCGTATLVEKARKIFNDTSFFTG